jgi:hypothetical protein
VRTAWRSQGSWGVRRGDRSHLALEDIVINERGDVGLLISNPLRVGSAVGFDRR